MAQFGVDKFSSPLAEVVKIRCGLQLPSSSIIRDGVPSMVSGQQCPPDSSTEEVALRFVEALMQAYRQMRTSADKVVEDYTGDLGEDVGPLSLGIQVQGAIALDRITRLGGLVVESAHDIIETCDMIRAQASLQLHEDPHARDCFKWRNELIEIDSRGFPMTYNRELLTWLESCLKRVGTFNQVPFSPPRSSLDTTPLSSNLWADWSPYERSLEAWERLETACIARMVIAKASGTRERRVRPSYQAWPRIRSGLPNLVSLRKMLGRPIFSAPPGFSLIVVELSDLELRCLADCRDNSLKAHMRLKELFQQDLDHVRYVASTLHGGDLAMPAERFEKAFVNLEEHGEELAAGWMTIARIVLEMAPRGFSEGWIDAQVREKLGEMTHELLHFEKLTARRDFFEVTFPELAGLDVDRTVRTVESALLIDSEEFSMAFLNDERSDTIEPRIRGALSGRKADPDLLKRLRELSKDESMRRRLTHGNPSLYESIFLIRGMSGYGRVRGMMEIEHRLALDHLDAADDIRKSVLYSLVARGYEVAAVAGDEFVILLPEGENVHGSDGDEFSRGLRTFVEDILGLFLQNVPGKCKVSEKTCW
jgi:hypothetical protein